jgi:hypothetical protein
MGMKIECQSCLKETAIPKKYDTQKYDGQITCRECGALLQVKLVKSKVQQCKVLKEGQARLDPAELVKALKEARQKAKQSLEGKS